MRSNELVSFWSMSRGSGPGRSGTMRREDIMSSYRMGKDQVRDYLIKTVPKDSSCLDVGACDGIWSDLLRNHLKMVAVEIFEPNIIQWKLEQKYVEVFNEDIRAFEYEHYDVIIFGDVIEHMTVEDAQSVLAYAYDRADEIIVAVPYRFKQSAMYGNEYERHIQDDLTHQIFMERYPGFEPLVLFDNYGYYKKVRP